jgi:hypothetical protein
MARQIRVSDEKKRGTMVTNPRKMNVNVTADDSPCFVGRVNTGGRKILRNIVVKANGGSRAYARKGLPVMLQKNAQGRWEVIGPSDRIISPALVSEVDLELGTVVSQPDEGFSLAQRPFSHFRGGLTSQSTPAGEGLWGANTFSSSIVVDGSGAEV